MEEGGKREGRREERSEEGVEEGRREGGRKSVEREGGMGHYVSRIVFKR